MADLTPPGADDPPLLSERDALILLNYTNTLDSLTEIGKRVGMSGMGVRHVLNRLAKQGHSVPSAKYRLILRQADREEQKRIEWEENPRTGGTNSPYRKLLYTDKAMPSPKRNYSLPSRRKIMEYQGITTQIRIESGRLIGPDGPMPCRMLPDLLYGGPPCEHYLFRDEWHNAIRLVAALKLNDPTALNPRCSPGQLLDQLEEARQRKKEK